MKRIKLLAVSSLLLAGIIASPAVIEATNAAATQSTPSIGSVYVLDGQNLKIWLVPKGGGSPTQFADLSGLSDSCQSTPYPWESAVSGTTMFWADDSCGDIYATDLVTGVSTDIYQAGNAPMYDEGYLTLDRAGNIWEQADSGSKLLELTAGTFTPHYYDVTGGTTSWGGMAYSNGYIYYGVGTQSNASIFKFQPPATPGSVSSIAVTTVATSVPNTGGGMSADSHGNVFYSNGNDVYELASGSSTPVIVPQTCTNHGIESMKFWQGNLYFSSWKPGVVCEFDKALTTATALAANPDPTSGSGFNPEGMALFGPANAGGKITVTVHFALGSSHVTYTAVGQLNWLKQHLKGATNVTISITGYVQPTAGSATDTSLALARATSVSQALHKLKVAATYSVHSGGLKSVNAAESRVAIITATW